MAEKDNNETAMYRTIVRRRFIGAAAMLALAAVLWHLGEGAPPAEVRIPAPQAEEWQPPSSEVLRGAQEQLLDGDTILADIDNDGGGVFDDSDDFVIVADDEVADIAGPTIVIAQPEVQPASESAKPQNDNSDSGKSFSAGVFANPKNAAALAAKINNAGWQTKTRTYQNADGKTLHQIVVVRLPDDDAIAEAKQQLLQNPPPSLFVVQIGAFQNSDRAQSSADELQDSGFAARVEKTNRNGVLLYRVRVAGFATRAAAEEAKRNLRALGYDTPQVIDLR